MNKFALLIGTGTHIHKNHFQDLSTPPKDVQAIQKILQNPEIGDFSENNITVLIDCSRQEIEETIYDFFSGRQKDDLLLFYFSGHGFKDLRNLELYLIASDSRKNVNELVKPTAVAAKFLHESMNDSLSQRQVIILDCCYSGLFPKDLKIKGDSLSINIPSSLGGKGRAILTASTATQFAFEKEGFELSVYTNFLVEALESGFADKDGDGYISPDELHEYVKDKIKETRIEMSPEFYPVQEGYKIFIAKAKYSVSKIDYKSLSDFLEKQQWEEAEQETMNIILEVAGRTESGELEDQDIATFPCSVINTLSQLWGEYSNEHFGFEAQRDVWMSQDISKDPLKFMRRVGWLEQNFAAVPAPINYSLDAPKGHLPLCFSFIFKVFSRIDACQGE